MLKALTSKEIDRIDHVINSNGATCTPIIVKRDRRPANEYGYVHGTLTMVSHDGRVFAVTAEHVINENRNKHVYSPIKPEWHMKYLRDYDWRIISIGAGSRKKDIDIDLVVAELSPEEIKEIDPRRVYEMHPSYLLEEPFIGFASGYLNKKHKGKDLEINKRAVPTSYGFTSDGIKLETIHPNTKPDLPIHMTFPFDRDDVIIWQQQTKIIPEFTAPKPNGLSGGPVVYCGDRESFSNDVQSPRVVGFLIEQSDKKRTLKAVTTDVLFNAVSPYPKK